MKEWNLYLEKSSPLLILQFARMQAKKERTLEFRFHESRELRLIRSSYTLLTTSFLFFSFHFLEHVCSEVVERKKKEREVSWERNPKLIE